MRPSIKFQFQTAITSSAVAPSLAVCAIWSLPLVIVSAVTSEPFRYIALALALLPVIAALILIRRFGNTRPEMLQSEAYQLRQAVLQSAQGSALDVSLVGQILLPQQPMSGNPNAMTTLSAEANDDAS